MSNKIFAALMGMENYHGAQALHVGDTLYLVKDPDNRLDHQAIKVVIPPIGEVGYIVNHAAMVPHGCWTGEGFYDAFYQQTCAKVRFMMKDMVIIELIEIMHVPVSQMDSIITEWQFREKA
ncbi:HIRAN domain-containing protein [Paenibacillus xylanexedens]|uniref:HIRAN domain-containing protein n=1 Tax=Paenibacillus xylanexedens TaxID=528191 RepID=UPI0011A87768|nr:HIRAN domain-containing protein [Paenibacillus xylanexedens]